MRFFLHYIPTENVQFVIFVAYLNIFVLGVGHSNAVRVLSKTFFVQIVVQTVVLILDTDVKYAKFLYAKGV